MGNQETMLGALKNKLSSPKFTLAMGSLFALLTLPSCEKIDSNITPIEVDNKTITAKPVIDNSQSFEPGDVLSYGWQKEANSSREFLVGDKVKIEAKLSVNPDNQSYNVAFESMSCDDITKLTFSVVSGGVSGAEQVIQLPTTQELPSLTLKPGDYINFKIELPGLDGESIIINEEIDPISYNGNR